MEVHPVAELFPMLSGAELQEMADSISKEGLLHPCCRQAGVLLDGRNRVAACKLAGVEPTFIEYTGDSPVAYIISANLKRRHLDKGQKIALAIEIRPHFATEAHQRKRLAKGRGVKHVENHPHVKRGEKSRDQAAKVVGLSGKLVSDAEAIKAADPRRFAKIKDGSMSVARAKKEIKQESAEKDRARARAALSDTMPSGGAVHHGDFRYVGRDVPDGSCTLIFTDPPYDRKSLPLYSDLGEFANRVLVEGGSLITFCGQYALDEVMLRLSAHLKYLWVCCCDHTGDVATMREYGIKVGWKPMLWFVKGNFRYDREVLVEDRVKSQQQKAHHAWGQSEVEARHFIDKLTRPGDLVCDPFCGGGTTAYAARDLGRNFWTCDIDPIAVQTTKDRLA